MCGKISFNVVIFAALSLSGCRDASQPAQSQIAPAPPVPTADSRPLSAESEIDPQHAESPDPVIALSAPPGWTMSERRPLPVEDHGFTIAYDHTSGLAVTFYQYTHGLTVISGDVNGELIALEMQYARDAIEQAVALGYWESAKEIGTQTVKLGDSEQQALQCRYILTIDGEPVPSEIYIWSHDDTFLKVRCTNRSPEADSLETVLRPLLTMLGSGSTATSPDENP